MSDARLFERDVIDVLRLAGYHVSPEQLLGSKRIDALAESFQFGKRFRYAIECKNYGKPLTREEVAIVYHDYINLIEARHVDFILLITKSGVTPASELFISDSKYLIHQTISDLLSTVMDFKSYLTDIIRSFDDDPVSRYYVPLRTDSEEDLETLVANWIGDSDSQPLAIMGSYGLGKTTFTKYLAAKLAQEALRDPRKRIPIVISLSLISSEQSLAGLLGKHFTYTSLVKNYNFQIFISLLKLGKFVIFLDGFDEMKHCLSWDEIQYNFQEISTLVTGKSKVIILGRPTIFATDDEYNRIISGLYKIGSKYHSIPGWPAFRSVMLGDFTKSQIMQFLGKYFVESNLVGRTARNKDGIVQEMMRGSGKKDLLDLARRPVQLRMLCEVLPGWEGNISDLSLALLYDHFIDMVIAREMTKISRKRFSREQRREFAREIAWWLWSTKNQSNLDELLVPDKIVKSFMRPYEEDLAAVRRDLVSACFLERKIGHRLYFPHRSFHEFLVAEKIAEMISLDATIDMSQIVSLLSLEIIDFLKGIMSDRNVLKLIINSGNYHGQLYFFVVDAMASSHAFQKNLRENLPAYQENRWFLLTAAIAMRDPAVCISGDYFLSRIVQKLEGKFALFLFICALLSRRSVDKNYIASGISRLCRVGEVRKKKKGHAKIISSAPKQSRSSQEAFAYNYSSIYHINEEETEYEEGIKRNSDRKNSLSSFVNQSEHFFVNSTIFDALLYGYVGDGIIDVGRFVARAIVKLENYCMIYEWTSNHRVLWEMCGIMGAVNVDLKIKDVPGTEMNTGVPRGRKGRLD